MRGKEKRYYYTIDPKKVLGITKTSNVVLSILDNKSDA